MIFNEKAINDILSNPRIKVVSFDVFDTVLTRNTAIPSDIFHKVSNRINTTFLVENQIHLKNFVNLRVEAERAAREWTASEDISLSDIYTCLAKHTGIDMESMSTIMDLEVEEEYAAIHRINQTAEAIKVLRHSKRRIIFTSDMYLPSNVIQDFLVKVGVYKKGDHLYISGEIGLKKASGNFS